MDGGSARGAGAWPAALLVALAVPLVLWGLGRYGVVNGDEAIYQGIAAEMVETGDWIHLSFRGSPRPYDTFMNAPLQYWARAVLISLFGDNAWTMRALSGMFGIASLLATWRLGLRLRDRSAALVGALVQLTTLQFVYLHSARTGELETALAFFLTLAALFFLRAVEEGRSFVPHHLCVVAIANLKLPVAAVPVLGVLLCTVFLPRTRAALRRYVPSAAWVLPLGVAWHVWRAFALPEEFLTVAAAMTGQASGAFAQTGEPGLAANAAFYARVLLFGGFPYALAYAPAGVFAVARARREGPAALAFGALPCFALGVLLFYLAVGKRFPWYVVPAYPFLSLCVGAWLVALVRETPRGLWLAAVAIVAALVPWLSAGATSFNPFAERARSIAMELHWRDALAADPAVGVPVAAALLALALAAAARSRTPRVRRALPVAFSVGLLATGAIRVVAPLSHVGHESELVRVHRALAAERAAGRPVSLPVRIVDPAAPLWGARYYFADAYEIVPVRGGGLLLFEKGDPRAAGRSISGGLPELARERARRGRRRPGQSSR